MGDCFFYFFPINIKHCLTVCYDALLAVLQLAKEQLYLYKTKEYEGKDFNFGSLFGRRVNGLDL